MKTKEKKKNNNKELYSFWPRLWKLIEPSQKQIKHLLLFVFIFELSRLGGPFILKIIIDLITNFTPEDISKLLWLIVAMFAVGQTVAGLDYFLDRKIMSIINNVEKYLPISAQRKMLNLSLSYHEKENTGNKISKIDRGVTKIVEFLAAAFWDMGPTVVQVILTTVVLFFVDWRFGLILLFYVPIFLGVTWRLNKIVYPWRKQRHDDYEASSGKMAQAIININTVKSFVQEKREEKEYASIRNKIWQNIKKEFSVIFRYNWGRNTIIDFGRVSIMAFGVYLVWHNSISLGSLVFIITISDKALISLFRISRLYDRVMESSAAIERLSFLDEEETVIINPENGKKPKKITGLIEFKNVSFTYDEARKKALDVVSLKINAGCVTALVGPSGGGKTTVARMIYRHYDPQKGLVLLDDLDLKKYDLSGFRRFISIVPQEVEIFNSTVGENIAYADPGADKEAITAAARIANAEEFIKDLTHGYDTLVGERGIKLSGGQRQPIGIARAILANPRILIFDEATSSLDSYSEKLIQEAMDKISKGRTVVSIAHRLSTIKKADKIIVLEDGKVVEQGNHIELSRARGGLYHKLLKLQEMGDVG